MFMLSDEAQSLLKATAEHTRSLGVKIENPRNDLDDIGKLASALEDVVNTLRLVIEIEED